MTTTTRLVAISAIAALASFAAHANGEGDNAPEKARAFMSTVTVEQVKQEARMPVRITEATGYTGVMSTASRDAVRAEALMAMRDGTTSRGERGPM